MASSSTSIRRRRRSTACSPIAITAIPTTSFSNTRRPSEQVTRADVLRVAKQYIDPSKFIVVVTGNPKDFGAPLSTLELPVQNIDLTIPGGPRKMTRRRFTTALALLPAAGLRAADTAAGARQADRRSLHRRPRRRRLPPNARPASDRHASTAFIRAKSPAFRPPKSTRSTSNAARRPAAGKTARSPAPGPGQKRTRKRSTSPPPGLGRNLSRSRADPRRTRR